MAWVLVSIRYPSFLQIHQLLLEIHPRIYLDSCTIYLDNKDFREYWVFDRARRRQSRSCGDNKAGCDRNEVDRSKVDNNKIRDNKV